MAAARVGLPASISAGEQQPAIGLQRKFVRRVIGIDQAVTLIGWEIEKTCIESFESESRQRCQLVNIPEVAAPSRAAFVQLATTRDRSAIVGMAHRQIVDEKARAAAPFAKDLLGAAQTL